MFKTSLPEFLSPKNLHSNIQKRKKHYFIDLYRRVSHFIWDRQFAANALVSLNMIYFGYSENFRCSPNCKTLISLQKNHNNSAWTILLKVSVSKIRYQTMWLLVATTSLCKLQLWFPPAGIEESAVKVQAERLSCPLCRLELGMRMMPLLHADLPPTPRSIIPAPVAKRTGFSCVSSPKHIWCLSPFICLPVFFLFLPIYFSGDGASPV